MGQGVGGDGWDTVGVLWEEYCLLWELYCGSMKVCARSPVVAYRLLPIILPPPAIVPVWLYAPGPNTLLNSCTSIGKALDSHIWLRRRIGDNVTKCNGAESSNAFFSFPEHFEGRRQSGEMYQKDCLPLLSTLCKFQRLKIKVS